MNKHCPICNAHFSTLYRDQIYCTDTCQRRAKYKRRSERKTYTQAERQQFIHDDRVHATIANPTADQLFDICKQILDNKIEKPVKILGFIPTNFMVPNFIELVEQQRDNFNEPMSWILQRREPDVMEVYKTL